MTSKHLVLEAPPAARKRPDSGRAARYLRSVLEERLRGVQDGFTSP